MVVVRSSLVWRPLFAFLYLQLIEQINWEHYSDEQKEILFDVLIIIPAGVNCLLTILLLLLTFLLLLISGNH